MRARRLSNECREVVESSELERENKQLIYSFDIRHAQNKITEVQISAITGQVVSVKQESTKKEAAEQKKETRENIRSPRSPLEYKRQRNGEDSSDEIKQAAFIVPARPSASSPAEFQRPGVLQLAYGYNSNFRAKGTPSEQDIPLTLRFAVSPRVLVEFDNDNFITQTAPDGSRASGVGSMLLGAQYVIQHQTTQKPAVSFAYFIKIPTANSSKGLGTGRFDHNFTGLISKNIGSITIDFNGTYLLAGRQSGNGYASSGQSALAFSRSLTKRVGGTAEISGFSRNDTQPGAVFGLAGASYQVNPRFSLYSGVRVGLTPAAPRIGVLGGITVGVANLYKKRG